MVTPAVGLHNPLRIRPVLGGGCPPACKLDVDLSVCLVGAVVVGEQAQHHVWVERTGASCHRPVVAAAGRESGLSSGFDERNALSYFVGQLKCVLIDPALILLQLNVDPKTRK
jgi:hypothetical protein